MVDTLKTVDGRLQLQLPTDPYAHGGGLLPESSRLPDRQNRRNGFELTVGTFNAARETMTVSTSITGSRLSGWLG